MAGNVDTHSLLLADFEAGFLYVDVHAVPPGGEGESVVLRGQVDGPAAGVAVVVPTLGGASLALLALALGAVGAATILKRR
jgi:hypothetical protein